MNKTRHKQDDVRQPHRDPRWKCSLTRQSDQCYQPHVVKERNNHGQHEGGGFAAFSEEERPSGTPMRARSMQAGGSTSRLCSSIRASKNSLASRQRPHVHSCVLDPRPHFVPLFAASSTCSPRGEVVV